MTVTTRPGGRSARIQRAVHDAVRQLQDDPDATLTVPQIAQRAGVTPSTIYRRWGDLAELLADVALERMRPDSDPPDTGSLHGDLVAWTEQYVDEMATPRGRQILRDVAAASGGVGGPACTCAEFNRAQLATIIERAASRGEQTPDLDALVNAILAPVTYRILFTADVLDRRFAQDLVAGALS